MTVSSFGKPMPFRVAGASYPDADPKTDCPPRCGIMGAMPRALVILPTTTYRAPDFVDAAVDLGIDLVVASEAGHALADQMGNRYLAIDCGEPEAAAAAIVDLARREPFDAVIAADDAGVVVAAAAAEELGLPHNRPEAAAATRDKLAMRRLLADGGVPQPRFAAIEPGEDPASAAAALGFPCVLKPLGLSGSRGVIRADSRADAHRAARRIRAILREAGEDPAAPLIVEEYVPGSEVALEGLVGPAGLEVLAIFDKPDPLEGPFFEETIYVTPAELDESTVGRIEEVVAAGIDALGLSHGPIHAEVRLAHGEATLIEIAARSIGGLCSRSLRFGMLGVSLEHLLLRAALGMPRRAMGRETRASGAMMLPIPADGVLRAVRWREAAMEIPGITGLEITIPVGQRVRRLPEGDRYLGFLFAAGETSADVEAALREAHAVLDIQIDPPG
jgi:biotin carboxylase